MDRSRLARSPERRPEALSVQHLVPREAHLSPAAAPPPNDSGAWLARYGELQASLFVTLARQLGLGGPGGRDAFGDLFQIAVTAAWAKERDGEPIRNPRAFLRQVIVNQRKMQLRSQRRHPATSFDELAATAESTGGPGVDAIADRRPSVSEQVERRELAELVTQILLTIERRARTVWTMRYLEGRSPDEGMPLWTSPTANTPACSSAPPPRSTASWSPTSPATGAPGTRALGGARPSRRDVDRFA